VPFLFFNADLVQHSIDTNGGSIAFVDDYTVWVTGSSPEANREGIEAVIGRAMDWQARSGATFEADKTAIIHLKHRPCWESSAWSAAVVVYHSVLGAVVDASIIRGC
jgi:hypothetical protein